VFCKDRAVVALKREVLTDQHAQADGARQPEPLVVRVPDPYRESASIEAGFQIEDAEHLHAVLRYRELFADDADVEKDRADPLRCVDGRVVPNLSGRVSKAAYKTVTLFFDIHPDTASTDIPEVKVEVRRSGTLIGTVPLRITQDTKKATIPYLAELGTASLPIGDYRLTMVLKQGAQTASASVSFTLGE